MRKFITIALVFTGYLLSGMAQKNITLEDILDGYYSPRPMSDIISTPGGENYTQISEDGKQIIKYSYKTGQPVETLFDVETARECPFEKIDGYTLNATENRILIYTDKEPVYRNSFKATYWLYDMKRNLVEPLSEEAGKQQYATFSPNGRMVAFSRDNNLYLKKLDYGTESAVTKDGKSGEIINGAPDWLHEEEFGMKQAFTWSPDSEFIAFLRFDESAVEDYTLLIYPDNMSTPSLTTYKYPRAGKENAKTEVYVYSVETKGLKKMDLPEANREYIPRLEFTPNADQLAIITLNRNQNIATLYYANPKSAICKQIYREESNTYVDVKNLQLFLFTPEHFIAVSEKDGFRHAYLYTINGIQVKQLTSGSWDITDIVGYNPASGLLYYQSAEESPVKRAIYSVDQKGKKNKLSRSSGYNQATFSSNFQYFVNTYSSLTTPEIISVCDHKGKPLYEPEKNEILSARLQHATIPQKELLSISSGSEEFNAWIIKPADFDNGRQYPVLLVQYSGPDSQLVLDKYEFSWTHYLASKGYIVVCADGIGTGGRGEKFRKTTYMNLGIKESDSQIDVAKYLGNLPYIDKNRIGIWGWSYGGFNTLMSMSRGNGIFKTGIAVAPVTDWRLYDTAYTERFMRTPNENTDGYNKTSLIELAPRLQGNLLLIHGTADDNVHVQHTFDYINALIKAGKAYDLQLYPNRGHGIADKPAKLYLYNQVCNYLFEKL